jgi:hypothetical protein
MAGMPVSPTDQRVAVSALGEMAIFLGPRDSLVVRPSTIKLYDLDFK